MSRKECKVQQDHPTHSWQDYRDSIEKREGKPRNVFIKNHLEYAYFHVNAAIVAMQHGDYTGENWSTLCKVRELLDLHRLLFTGKFEKKNIEGELMPAPEIEESMRQLWELDTE